MESTKNKFKKEIGNMSYNSLIVLQGKLKSKMMKAKAMRSNMQNPYGNKISDNNSVRYNVKLLKWKIALISNKLHNKFKAGE